MNLNTRTTKSSLVDGALQRLLVPMACVAALSACAVAPQPATRAEVTHRVAGDMRLMYADQEPITGAVTLDEAIARGLKYNLDYRLKQMESALALGLTESANFDMLPRLVANAGYRSRNNDNGGVTRGILDGEVTTRPTTSDDRSHSLAGAEFSWNALDFGVSYYRARQLSNQAQIAEERRRKVVQNIIQDVRTSYWRALGAQRLSAQAADVMARARQAIGRSREAEAQKLIAPATALNYQRALLDATSQLNQRRQDLEIAKRELAALMNVPSGVEFTLANAAQPRLPDAPADLRQLEELALLQRPELREEDYRRRITADEVRRQMMGMLPGLSFDAGVQYDSNSLSYNNRWAQGGVRISWDLLRLAALPAMQRAQQAQEQTDTTRRMALSMAVLTQLRVGAERYRLALEDLQLADEAAQVDERMAVHTKAAVSARLDSELEAIRTQARAVLGGYQRAGAYANAQIAYGRLHNTLGFDALPDAALNKPLSELAVQVREQLKANEADAFRFTSNLFGRSAPRVAVRIQGVADDVLRVRATADVSDTLRRQGVLVDQDSGVPMTLQFQAGQERGDVARSTWTVQLPARGQSAAQSLPHSVSMPLQSRPSADAAAAVAAINLHLPSIRAWAAQSTNQGE